MLSFIFTSIILTSIWVLGIKIVTSDGMALEALGRKAEAMAKKNKVWDVLLYCEWCMPSLHTAVITYPVMYVMGMFGGIGILKSLLLLPYCISGASFITGMFWFLYNIMVSKKSCYDNAQKYYYHKTKQVKQSINAANG